MEIIELKNEELLMVNGGGVGDAAYLCGVVIGTLIKYYKEKPVWI